MGVVAGKIYQEETKSTKLFWVMEGSFQNAGKEKSSVERGEGRKLTS